MSTDPGPIRIMLVDDHAVLRSGLRLLLEREEGLEPVGVRGAGASACGPVAAACGSAACRAVACGSAVRVSGTCGPAASASTSDSGTVKAGKGGWCITT